MKQVTATCFKNGDNGQVMFSIWSIKMQRTLSLVLQTYVWLFLLLVLQKGSKEFLNWIVYLHEDADFCNRFCQAVKNTNLMLFDSEFSRILALPVSFKPGQFPVATCVGSKVANF